MNTELDAISAVAEGSAAQQRRDMLTLVGELGHGRGLRIAAVADILRWSDFTDCDMEDAAFQVRSEVYSLFGGDVSDADEDESGGGIPAIESCIRLARHYGPLWVEHAYTSYLTSFTPTGWKQAAAEAADVASRIFGEYEAKTRKVVEVKRYRVAA